MIDYTLKSHMEPRGPKDPPWPLPLDYYSYSPQGRKECRKAIVSCRTSPGKAKTAWWFFRNYYLNHAQAYFYKEFKPSPDLHFDLIHYWNQYQLNAIGSPRNTAKSTVIGLEVPLMEMVSPSMPGIEIGLVLAKDQFVEERFDKLMMQITDNPRIREDFGDLRPPKGSGTWNKHLMHLTNHVWVKGFSVDGRKRGARPDLMIIDDPEFDPAAGTNVAQVNADLGLMLSREILGMLSPHSRLLWIGTLLHSRSFLYHILMSDDVRFNKWNKKIYAAEWTDSITGRQQYLWESRLTPEFLANQRAIMGEGAYKTEYCNDPRSDAAVVLMPDPILSQYHLDSDNWDDRILFPHQDPNPLLSKMPIRWHDCGTTREGVLETVEHTSKFGEWAQTLQRYMTVDYASTINNMSDYSAAVVWGMDKRNTIWVLDAWQDKVRSAELIKKIWELGTKWGVRTVGIEAVSVQDEIRQQVADFMNVMARTGRWTPRVIPIKYPVGLSKEDRIGSLEWRFNRGRIKLPAWAERAAHPLGALYRQIEDFTPDLSRLPKDDLIDALSMAHSMVRGSGRAVNLGPEKPEGWLERLMAGQLNPPEYPTINILHAFSASELSQDLINKIAESRGVIDLQPQNQFTQAMSEAPAMDFDDMAYGDPYGY